LKEENQELRRKDLGSSIWEKRVDDLKLEVTRLDSELWASKDARHIEAKQHAMTV
jgi:hypothetical protein